MLGRKLCVRPADYQNCGCAKTVYYELLVCQCSAKDALFLGATACRTIMGDNSSQSF